MQPSVMYYSTPRTPTNFGLGCQVCNKHWRQRQQRPRRLCRRRLCHDFLFALAVNEPTLGACRQTRAPAVSIEFGVPQRADSQRSWTVNIVKPGNAPRPKCSHSAIKPLNKSNRLEVARLLVNRAHLQHDRRGFFIRAGHGLQRSADFSCHTR
jgi:hypothetical protein